MEVGIWLLVIKYRLPVTNYQPPLWSVANDFTGGSVTLLPLGRRWRADIPSENDARESRETWVTGDRAPAVGACSNHFERHAFGPRDVETIKARDVAAGFMDGLLLGNR